LWKKSKANGNGGFGCSGEITDLFINTFVYMTNAHPNRFYLKNPQPTISSYPFFDSYMFYAALSIIQVRPRGLKEESKVHVSYRFGIV
jgi:hypothetical protein